jgi:hypothetical protein
MGTTIAAESGSAAVERCANCAAAVTGKYCAECGQRHEHAIHSIWHFLRESTEDLTHADSRLWRTIVPLLIRPGFLTREFLDGRRVRYLPPVRLYLVLSVLFFLIAAMVPQPPGAPAGVVVAQKGSQIVLSPLGATGVGASPISEARASAICGKFVQFGTTDRWANRLQARFEAACVKVVMDNGRTFRESFLHNAGRAMFVLLPLLALVMQALYRKPPRQYVEHLLFFVHDHAFLFLALGIYMPLAALAPAPVRETVHAGLSVYVPIYFYVSMRRVYGQGRLLTGTKLAALACAYLILGTLTIAAASVYSLLTL